MNTSNNGTDDIFTVKYDVAGNVLWAKKTGGLSIDAAYAITSDPWGNFIIGGQGNNFVFGSNNLNTWYGSINLFLGMYDTNGNEMWAVANGASGTDQVKLHSVAADRFGNVFAAGSTENFGNSYMIVASDTIRNWPCPGMFNVKLNYNNSTSTINTVTENSQLTLFPNPSNGQITLQITNSKLQMCKLEIYNSLGEIVFYSHVPNFTSPISLNLPAGIYFVRAMDEEKIIDTKKIVIE